VSPKNIGSVDCFRLFEDVKKAYLFVNRLDVPRKPKSRKSWIALPTSHKIPSAAVLEESTKHQVSLFRSQNTYRASAAFVPS